jgi:putative MFS transporter
LLAQALIVGLLGTETRRRSLEAIAAEVADPAGDQQQAGGTAGGAKAAVE